MFNNPSKILAHISSVDKSNFVTPDYILSGDRQKLNLFHRHCPHRMYPLADVGTQIDGNIVCKFHKFEWDKFGTPINNNRQITCGQAEIGKSGLIFKHFKEPNHFWVDDLSKETNLQYSHSTHGTSVGSWLWMMEIQADLLHIWKGGIHPKLASITDLNAIDMHDGDGWILQTCTTGWWLFVYPFTFIEWSKGCLSINYTVPKDKNSEFGFDWITQFYYDPVITQEKRIDFETLDDVFREDVTAIEAQKGGFFPLMNAQHKLENHCVHFGKWVTANLNR